MNLEMIQAQSYMPSFHSVFFLDEYCVYVCVCEIENFLFNFK